MDHPTGLYHGKNADDNSLIGQKKKEKRGKKRKQN
jgi:hypothetical protein